MYIETKKKKQKDGSDSWIITEWEDSQKKDMLNKYMVYTDPALDVPFTEDEMTYIKDNI